jgi:hypothetical protein
MDNQKRQVIISELDMFTSKITFYKINQVKERDFCSQMMGANKLYRKEDIINMGSKVVNAGWGPKGADTYSIWLADIWLHTKAVVTATISG